MKRLFAFLLALIFTAALFSGCKETPEKPIVARKDSEQMLEKAKGNNNSKADDESEKDDKSADNTKSIVEMLNAPDKFIASEINYNDTVEVNANADIVIPDVQGVPTLRVSRHSFTQSEADKILEYFIGDAPFKDGDASIETARDRYLKAKADLAKETDPAKRKTLEAIINDYESNPERDQQKIKDASKTFIKNNNGEEYIKGFSNKDDSYIYLEIINDPSIYKNKVRYTKANNGYALSKGTYLYEWEKASLHKMGINEAEVTQLPLNTTKDEAKMKADEVISALGIGDMMLASIEEVFGDIYLNGGDQTEIRHVYKLEYVRVINGVPLTYADNKIEEDAFYETDENGEVSPNWVYETVSFLIDDRGIIEFIWQSPYDIEEIITENTVLLPFEDIHDTTVTMLLITWVNQTEGIKTTLDISEAKLGLMRIAERNNYESALIVPVWDFFGSRTIEMDGKTLNLYDNKLESIITINAIDGTVIDRYLGH